MHVVVDMWLVIWHTACLGKLIITFLTCIGKQVSGNTEAMEHSPLI
jgi:hypothetical protein